MYVYVYIYIYICIYIYMCMYICILYRDESCSSFCKLMLLSVGMSHGVLRCVNVAPAAEGVKQQAL